MANDEHLHSLGGEEGISVYVRTADVDWANVHSWDSLASQIGVALQYEIAGKDRAARAFIAGNAREEEHMAAVRACYQQIGTAIRERSIVKLLAALQLQRELLESCPPDKLDGLVQAFMFHGW